MFVHTLVHMFPWHLTVKRSIVFWRLPSLWMEWQVQGGEHTGDSAIAWVILSTGHCFHHLHVLPWAKNTVWNWSTAVTGKYALETPNNVCPISYQHISILKDAQLNPSELGSNLWNTPDSCGVSRLGCVHTTKRLHMNLLVAVPRPLLQGILGTTISVCTRVHISPNILHWCQEFDRADLKDAGVLQHLLDLGQSLWLWSLVRTKIGDVEGSSNHNSLVRLKNGGNNCYLNLKDEYKWQNF